MRKTENQKHGWQVKGLNQEGCRRNDVQESLKKESVGFVNNTCDKNPCFVVLRLGFSWKLLSNVR